MIISLIVAASTNNAIGKDNQLLWHLPNDMKFFKNTTWGMPVVMGRKTWDSIPPKFRPLPGRANVVVTRQPGWRAEGAMVAHALDDALAQARSAEGGERVFVIGGAELYALALPRADELVLTEIERDYEGDARFPDWPRADFEEVSRERHRAAAPNDFDFSFATYRRRGAQG